MSEATTEPTPAAPAAPAAEVVTPPAEVTPAAEPVKDAAYWEAEASKWKTHSRKHEDSSKTNADKAKRLDELEESQKTELQKAADAAATAKADADATRSELARMRAAVKHGLSEDDLELLGTHGTPEEIETRAERLATRLKGAEAAKPKPDFGGGDKGTDVTSRGAQLTEADLARMKPEEIVAAKAAGRLNTLLNIT